ncbi:MAG: hypothetical protein JWQ57_3722, partial [Mucilaginibacter sp.]|nr:hypothetical protein [Mucilaginibacter sp.]
MGGKNLFKALSLFLTTSFCVA